MEIVYRVKKEIQDLCYQHPDFYLDICTNKDALPRVLNGFGVRHFFCRRKLMPHVRIALASENPQLAWEIVNLNHSSQNEFAYALSTNRDDKECISRLFFWLMLRTSLLRDCEIQEVLNVIGFCDADMHLFKRHKKANKFAPGFSSTVKSMQTHWNSIGVEALDIESAVALIPISFSSFLKQMYVVTISEASNQSIQNLKIEFDENLNIMFRELSQSLS